MSKNSLPSELNKKQWESNLVRFEKAKNARKYTKVVDEQNTEQKQNSLSWTDLSAWLQM